MAKKRRFADASRASSKSSAVDQNGTLQEMLDPNIVNQLKKQAEQWKLLEEQRKEEQRKQEEATLKMKQKQLENNFEHLLNHSNLDWRKYK